MTTYFPFVSGPNIFQFQPTLDNQVYSASVTWNLFRQGWYLNLVDSSGNFIVSKALVGSPSALNLQSLSWAMGVVAATVINPHGYKLGTTLQLTVSGVNPIAYNGIWMCLITGPTTFTYPLPAYPGQSSALGAVSSDINLVWDYFQTTTLVFRDASQTFEVVP
jgi:hypothetical protein